LKRILKERSFESKTEQEEEDDDELRLSG